MMRRLLLAAAVLLVALAALGTRLQQLPAARFSAGWYLADGDSHYHLRRIEQTIQRGGRVPMFDPELSYPDGQLIQWHGGYDLAVAGWVVTWCGSEPERSCLTTAAVTLTPLLGLLNTMLLLLLGWRLGGALVGLLTGALFALWPFTAAVGAVWYVDHHVAEPLMVTLWLLLLTRRRAVLAGLVAALAFAVYPSALLAVGATVAGLGGGRLLWARRLQGFQTEALRFCVSCAVGLVPVVLVSAFPHQLEPSATSLFSLVVVAALAVALLVSESAMALVRRRPVLAGVAAPALLILLGALAARHQLAPLAKFGVAQGLWLGVVQQASLVDGGAGIALVLLLALLLSVAGVALARQRALVDARAGGASASGTPRWFVVAIAALPLTVAGVLQIRFLPAAGALLCPLVALVGVAGARWLYGRAGREGPLARRLAVGLVVGYWALMVVPLKVYLTQSSQRDPFLQDGILLLRRLAARGPDARGPILSDWTWGHHILWHARCPTVASPFILSGVDSANVEARRALLGPGTDRLRRLVQRRRVRYVLISNRFWPKLAARSVGQAVPRRPLAKRLMGQLSEVPSWLRLVDQQGGVRLFEVRDYAH